ncbi:MAG: amino acid ABC transporter permease [Lachnospiraceae bacterium]|nr:amino acid ABC transporter permease [Lachnospiraceae bacterium]
MTIQTILLKLLQGMMASMNIFFLTLLFSLPLGLLVSFGRMSKNKIISTIVTVYISIMRGTPLMLQLIVVYYGPHILFGVGIPREYNFWATIIGFSINYAAYFGEIFRSGIQAVPVGQREAAKVLGYSRVQTFVRIIFPQMVKRVLPPVTNEVITLVKDTSLAFVLGYTEMFTIAKQITAKETSLVALFIAGVFYYIFNFIVAWFMGMLEKKLSYFN